MKYIRIIVVAIFLGSLGLYGASKMKEVVQENENMPVITSEQTKIEVPVEYTEEQLLAGLQAWDEEDGDLTDEIMINGFSQFIEKGTCNVSYIVFDSGNQPAVYKRQVIFSGYQSPRFSLTQPLVFYTGENIDIKGMIKAQDEIDGDITEFITISQNNTVAMVPGVYDITVQVSNRFGDTVSVTLPVHILDAGKRKLSLQNSLVYLKKGDLYSAVDMQQEVKDHVGNLIPAENMIVESNVDTEVPGVYEVHYSTNDAETWLTVIVQE